MFYEEKYPLHTDVQKGNIDGVKEKLRKGFDVNAREEKFSQTPLMFLAWENRPEVIKLLLEAGADIEAQDASGQTAVMVCAERCSEKSFRVLANAGANLDTQDYQGDTALMYAMRSRTCPGLIPDLLRAGADPNICGSLRRTPLMAASLLESKAEEVMRVLLEAGADVHARDQLENTALSQASHYGSPESVRILLEAGADVHAQDYRGRTPLMLSSWSIRGVDSPEILKILLKAGADVHARSDSGMTALMYAARDTGEDCAESLRILLEAGSGIDLRDNFGESALGHAVTAGSLDAVETLLEAGAYPNFQDEKGRTPLVSALLDRKESSFRIMRKLLDVGADPSIPDNSGWDARKWAEFGKRKEEMLLFSA